jgi:hypothetical protein
VLQFSVGRHLGDKTLRNAASTRHWFGLALAAFVFVLGCGDDPVKPPPAPLPGDQAVPDFALIDVNPNSTSHSQTISPRQHLGRVSAWYFGHAN